MFTSQHLLERISERVPDEAAQNSILALCLQKAARITDDASYAVLIGKINMPIGRLTYDENGRGESNGNMLVLIIRNRSIVTAMWRRESQPWTTEALRVERLIGNK